MPPYLSPEEQGALAVRVGQGDASAEEEFVRLFSPMVSMMMAARIRDPEAARELSNDVLMAVVCALRNGKVRYAERLSAFVHGTARNLANNYIRSRSRKPLEEPLLPEMAIKDPSDGLDWAERLRLVRRELKRLNRTDRKILSMTLVEGFKSGEIAQKVGLSPEAVRARKSRAIKRIIETTRRLLRS